MQKQIWYGIKGGNVRLFAQDPSENQNISGVGQCTLTSEDGNLDVTFPEGGSLFSNTNDQQETTSQAQSQATA